MRPNSPPPTSARLQPRTRLAYDPPVTRPRALGVALLAAGVVGAGCSSCKSPAPSPPAPPVAPVAALPGPDAGPEAPSATVVASMGRAEAKRGPAGAWTELKVGERINAADAVRTEADSQVDLAVRDARLRLHERSELAMKAIGAKSVRARVKGRLEADSIKGREVVEVEAEGSDAVMRSEGSHFAMMADGRGVVAVASVEGRVNLTAAGKSVDVETGQVSRVKGKAPPEKPTRALRSLLLKIDWPADKATGHASLPLAGVVEVGTRVEVQGRPVEVDHHGFFSTVVSLRDGMQSVAVIATDVLGRKARRTQRFELDKKRPDVKLKDRPWR
jgi:hypothetical protein